MTIGFSFVRFPLSVKISLVNNTRENALISENHIASMEVVVGYLQLYWRTQRLVKHSYIVVYIKWSTKVSYYSCSFWTPVENGQGPINLAL